MVDLFDDPELTPLEAYDSEVSPFRNEYTYPYRSDGRLAPEDCRYCAFKSTKLFQFGPACYTDSHLVFARFCAHLVGLALLFMCASLAGWVYLGIRRQVARFRLACES